MRTHLHLNHQASLSPELDHVAVDVHFVLRLQAFEHGVDPNVGACASDTSTTNRVEAGHGRQMSAKANRGEAEEGL